jgi:type IV conjugative transfer system protein TraL
MDLENHRIYTRMSEPWRLLGLTKDEVAVLLGAFALFMQTQNKRVGFFMMAGALIGVWLLKRFKKHTENFRLQSWLHWTFGLRSAALKHPPHAKDLWYLP